MGDTGLYGKLRRLRRGGEDDPVIPPPDVPLAGVSGLDGLESALLGAPADTLSLKERLERLVAAAARRGERRVYPTGPPAVPLEELIQGRRVTNERGEFFLVEDDVHLETLHGDVPLTRFRGLDPGTVALLSGDASLEGFDLADAVFLDTETTGLAGGTGTAAFLVGIGYVEGERFVVRQYFMRDYHEEAALLRGLAQDLARFRHIVTFNGKTFDIPLLEARYAMNRERFPLSAARHFDLLFPARRLWKARLESCRLQVLEAALIGFRRVGDVAGAEIPNIYFDFVRRRDGRAMARVLQHNRLDIVSLAALAALAGQWVEGGRAEDPRDVFALAGLYERAALFDQSEAHYRRLVDADSGPVRVPALMRLADRAKRKGDFSVALPLWEEAAESGDWWAVRELARHHEHRSRDLEKALELVDFGLDQVLGAPGIPSRALSDFRRRRERLTTKLSRAGD
jgi:uncharacterized protein YprB with RNaseH-like and TPR domain